MATFKYTGEAPNGPFKMYGAEWDAGKTSEIEEGPFAAKLRGNPFFEEIKDEPKAQAPAPKQATPKKQRKEVTDGEPNPNATE